MIAEGIVNERGVTQKGTPKVKVGANWYLAGQCDISTLKTGQKIGIEFDRSQDGKVSFLKTWTMLPHQPGNSSVQEARSVSDDAEMRFISNCVGQAIAAGTIKMPGEILAWYKAAQSALKGEGPKGEDDIPY